MSSTPKGTLDAVTFIYLNCSLFGRLAGNEKKNCRPIISLIFLILCVSESGNLQINPEIQLLSHGDLVDIGGVEVSPCLSGLVLGKVGIIGYLSSAS